MNVCPECFGNATLKRRLIEIRPDLPDDERCDFHPRRKAVPIEEVGKIVEPALRANYAVGEWRFDEREGDDLYTIVGETTGAEDDDVVNSVAEWLVENDFYWPPEGEQPFFGLEQAYVPIQIDGYRHGSLWRRFREAILHRQRFFNEAARGFLTEIFEGVQHQSDIDNKPAFYRIEPDPEILFHRARLIRNEDDFADIAKDPPTLMGPPPAGLRRAGRMNAAGIAVFYGAVERDTAIAELRPPVGSLISVASFQVDKPMHVLDLTRFSGPGRQLDIFNKNQPGRAAQWAFMQSFASEISQPILPGDEHLEYVPAQVVAEYLTSQPLSWHGEQVTPDAILFRSAQRSGGRNIAIMGDAGRILTPSDPPGTVRGKPSSGDDARMLQFSSPIPTTNAPGLAYVEGSLKLMHVESATYSISTYLPSSASPSDEEADLDAPDF